MLKTEDHVNNTDARRLREDLETGVRLATSLGLDVSDVQIPS